MIKNKLKKKPNGNAAKSIHKVKMEKKIYNNYKT